MVSVEPRETRSADAMRVDDRLGEHGRGANPQPAGAVKRLVHHERLEALRVTRQTDDPVLTALVMTVATRSGFGGEGREAFSGGHGSAYFSTRRMPFIIAACAGKLQM